MIFFQYIRFDDRSIDLRERISRAHKRFEYLWHKVFDQPFLYVEALQQPRKAVDEDTMHLIRVVYPHEHGKDALSPTENPQVSFDLNNASLEEIREGLTAAS